MGVPLPPAEGEASSLQGAGGAHEAQANGLAHRDALLNQHDASTRGLSSLLLPLRVAHASLGLDHAPLSLAALMRGAPPAARALHTAQPPSSPPAPAWLEPYDWSSPSPPPLVPASDSESEEDWEEEMAPPVASAAPNSSQGPSLDDLCPWRLVDDAMQEARLNRPRRDGLRQRPPLRPRGGAGRLLLGDGALLSGSGFGRREPRLAARAPASSQVPLEDELASMAGRMAQLVRAHQDWLRQANPAVTAGLQDVANQLHSLAAVVALGPPPPA